MSQTTRKPDRLGWILGLTSTAYFMVALDALVRDHGAAVLLLVFFVLRERGAPEPMLPLRLLSVPAFTAGNVTAFLMSGAIFAAAFLTFQYFQLVRGYSPLATSVYLLPWLATPSQASAGGGTTRHCRTRVFAAGPFLGGAGTQWR